MFNTEILAAIFYSIGDGLSVINRDHEIIMANKGIMDLFGKDSLPENQGRKCFEEFQGRQAICDNCPAEETFKEGVSGRTNRMSCEIGIRKIVMSHNAYPLKDGDGAVTHAVIGFKDVTHLVKLEEQLFSSARLAGIDKLAAGIAHGIRNPLGNIMATAQFCLNKFELNEDVRKYLKTILRSSERVDKVVKNLLDLAKPEEASFKRDCVGRLIGNVCNLVGAKCLKHHVRLKKRFSGRLPQILLDEKLLEEAFLNLMLNAVDAMPKGGRLAVATQYDHDTEEIVISFADSGCGIPEEYLPRVFDPFFTTKKDGTGLGLYLTRQIIKLHKGSIVVESKPACGSEVIVRLPAV